MSIKLKEMFKNKYVKSIIDGKNINIYNDEPSKYIYIDNLLMNELLCYIVSEGYYYNILKEYSGNYIDCLEEFINDNGIDSKSCIGDVVNIFFDEYVNEDMIKCMWVVIPKDVYDNMINKYDCVKTKNSCMIITKSFKIVVFYTTKYMNKDVYVGYVLCKGYYRLYKDYLNLGGRVLCDDDWFSGRLFYGIKSDSYYLKSKFKRLNNKINKIKNKIKR